ncbi:MAG: hypothetical protein ACTSRG_19900 [Candidatus Helarchaeota archaeon]
MQKTLNSFLNNTIKKENTLSESGLKIIKDLINSLKEPTDTEKELILKFVKENKGNKYLNRWLYSSDRDRIFKILKLLNWI